jgi:hypothetical protein
MTNDRRKLVLALVFVGVCVALAVTLGRSSSTGSATKAGLSTKNASAIGRIRESQREAQIAQGTTIDPDSPAAEDLAARAYPGTEVTLGERQAAIAAGAKVAKRGPKHPFKWESLGPTTLNVDRLGTQTYQRGTQWSGRVTALAVDPKCDAKKCALYVAAAGGGVWRSKDALANKPKWTFITGDIPTSAIGSITVDPTDPSGNTIYVGTGEANSSGDSEAGLGLYRSTDGGDSWSLVGPGPAGSAAVAGNRSIGGVAIDPNNANHILIATRSGTRGVASNGGAVTAPGPATGVYESTDGGATFTLTRSGTAFEVKFDPSHAGVAYAALGGVGLIRSTTGGTTWETIFSGTRGRYSFSPVTLGNGNTRVYLSDANAGSTGSQAYRVDDAGQPAATLIASSNAAWTRLSNPVDGTPGYASYGYCDGQCTYDMAIASPASRPNMVVLSGLMNYNELPPYAPPGGQRSEGRSVLLSTDAGATWTDQTGDAQSPGESQHPDQHAIAFVPSDPDQMFLGSDGGVIRTNGTYTDISSQCDTRGLSGVFLSDCHAWLSRVPTMLEPINSGLGTLQMFSISVSHQDKNLAITGTQDNGSLNFSGSDKWLLGVTGDGGDSGFDAANDNTSFHTYYTGWLDVNFRGDDPKTWLWVGDQFFPGPPAGESIRMYPPTIADPVTPGTIFEGASHVWRTQDWGGDQAFLEAHCNTTNQFGTSDQLFTGNCGDFQPIGPSLTAASLGTRSGGNMAALDRGTDSGTLWAATSNGRVFVSKNADGPAASVTFSRIDTAAQPTRFPSSVSVDESNPNHAIVTYSGYSTSTPGIPGHVYDVVFDPVAGTATWTDISYDLGDQPILDSAFDSTTGDTYVSTDFGVNRLVSGTTTWIPAADGLPTVTVSGLRLTYAKSGTRTLYAATHGRGAYRLKLR